nr:hypothetical protein [Ktedonobacteraceae bacterium]
MWHIQINAQCYGKFGELFPAEKEPAELFLEGFVSCLLLDFFEVVLMEDVTITFAPTAEMEQLQYCAISIEADGELLPQLSGMRNVESTELALESKISTAFREIFEIVHIKQVTISASPAVLPIHLSEKE